ncbi:MAG: PQQ-dependent sugar dehydrogenase [Deltaproteobacteria bacterium]|nr:PQQ-dependent sugar dehydrogenase [Deltaproteobacteria bacterium]
MRIPVLLIACLSFAGCSGGSPAAPATATVPSPASWPTISLAPVAGGFVQPVDIAHAGDGSGRIFVVEQGGRIRILDNGAALPSPFLDISPRIACCGEQGLLGVAFPPGFSSSARFYVNYTRNPDGATVIARYRVSADNANAADPASEEIVLTVPQPFANHNGGKLAFGPDHFLYIGMGDGGGGGDPLGNAQNPGSLLGKMLRIDVESGVAPYAVPPDNPFLLSSGYRPEIWALGLRNPWRFSFDRRTGDLYIGDVGQGAVEEVDFQPAGSAGGQNYGWNIMEGAGCFGGGACGTDGFSVPVATYDHSQGCSVTGGVVYGGTDEAVLQGIYFYGDFCTGRIWGLRSTASGWDAAELIAPVVPPRNIAAFGEDEAGNVYVANYASGELLKIQSP